MAGGADDHCLLFLAQSAAMPASPSCELKSITTSLLEMTAAKSSPLINRHDFQIAKTFRARNERQPCGLSRR
jgi:hypothetical protein